MKNIKGYVFFYLDNFVYVIIMTNERVKIIYDSREIYDKP